MFNKIKFNYTRFLAILLYLFLGLIFIYLVFLFVLKASFPNYFSNSFKTQVAEDSTFLPQPSIFPTELVNKIDTLQNKNPFADLKNSITFNYPVNWVYTSAVLSAEKDIYTFYIGSNPVLELLIQTNYPYKTLDNVLVPEKSYKTEFLKNNYKALKIIVDGDYEHTLPYTEFIFLDTQTSILYSFKFNQSNLSNDEFESAVMQIIDSLSNNLSFILPNKTDLISINNGVVTIKYPKSLNAELINLDYYNYPTIHIYLEKNDVKNELWVGSFAVYSTSGNLCYGFISCFDIEDNNSTINIGESLGDFVTLDKLQKSEELKNDTKLPWTTEFSSESQKNIKTKPYITIRYNNEANKKLLYYILSNMEY